MGRSETSTTRARPPAAGGHTGGRPAPLTLAERARQRLQARHLRRMLAEMERRSGPIPPEVLARVEREWSAD